MSNYIVYRITNLINNRIYIGSTKNFEARKAEHFGQLRNNKHHNYLLQADFKIYGEDSFVMEIIRDGFKNRQSVLIAEYELILTLPIGSYNIDKNLPVEGIHKVKKKNRKKIWVAHLKWKSERKKRKTQNHRLKDHPLLDSIAQQKKDREMRKQRLHQ